LLLALIGAGIASLTAVLAALLSRRGLRPLRRLAGAAEEIERTPDPTKRLPAAIADDEIGQLSGVLNRMLAALQRAQENERRFLADASHELRTPVTTLLGNVEYAARHGAEPEVLSDLRRDAARLARMVDDLLALERAGAGAREPERVALHELVQSVVAERRADGARVAVERTEPAFVSGEPGALSRLLENLIENARVHGPPAGQVTVMLQRHDGEAVLTVRDEGAGPDPAHRERVFERFWRGPEATQTPGSGLGLSIVAAVAERHGGSVSVEGPAFIVRLPADGDLRDLPGVSR
jgi:signal transduction histidine kinase